MSVCSTIWTSWDTSQGQNDPQIGVAQLQKYHFTRGDMQSLQHIPETCTRNIFISVHMLWFCPCYAPINSKLQHPPSPPSRAKPGHLNFWRLDRSSSRPLGPKWCSNALPYRRICLSYPTKEQSSSAPDVFNKDLLNTFFVSQWLTNASSLPDVQTRFFYRC